MNPVIPAPVPVPLPAPAWLLQFLLVFTFILHVLPMNFLLGGTVILTLSGFLGCKRSRHRELAVRAARALPPVVAFTITLGVAPLLFLQLVYGQLFYTSSVLMAWFWLAVVFLVLIGYYGVYWFNMQQDELGPRARWVMLGTALVFVLVALIFSRNMSFMLRPEEFYVSFLKHKVGLIVGPVGAADIARLLHFIVGSLAVAGLGLAILSRTWSREAPDLAVWARRYGVKWFMGATAVQIFVGLWFLTSLPVGIRHLFLGGDALATAILVAAIALALVAMMTALRNLALGGACLVGTLVLMAVIRHLVRVAYLRPYFDPRALPVEGQWVVFTLFALLLVAGLATVGWMLWKFFLPGSARAASGQAG